MDRIDKLHAGIINNGFNLNDIITTDVVFGRTVNITFRDLLTEFLHSRTYVQSEAMSKFEVDSYDFKKMAKITDKNKLKKLYEDMFRFVANHR